MLTITLSLTPTLTLALALTLTLILTLTLALAPTLALALTLGLDPAQCYIWIDVFSTNFHNPSEGKNGGEAEPEGEEGEGGALPLVIVDTFAEIMV